MTAAAPASAPPRQAHPGSGSVPGSDRPLLPPGVVAIAAAAGAATLALSSTGSMVVAAALLAVAVADLRSALALVLAVASVAARFSTVTFDDVAGIQSVLGTAGIVGPPAGAASAWLAAVAVLLALRRPDARPGNRAAHVLVVVAGGALSAAIVAGPGPSELGVRVASTLAAAAVGAIVLATDRWPAVRRARPLLALALGAGAVIAAAWPA